jgi:hypothetical protein
MTEPAVPSITDLDNGPYDIEFFFDPGCPFAWQTSVWLRRVTELRGIRIGWRFIALQFLNEGKELPETLVDAQRRSLAFLRVCAAARARFDNGVVGDLYQAWGDAFWYDMPEGGIFDRIGTMAERVNAEGILKTLDLPDDLASAQSDTAWDAVIRSETDEAIRRTGPDVGTPIITYDPPLGNSLFGPVISSVPDDATSIAFYDALRTFADFPGFSELKRTNRAVIDLPLMQQL